MILSPALTDSLQFRAADSFTAEVVMRTTADSGVIIGSDPSAPELVAASWWTAKCSSSLADLTASVRRDE